MKYKAAEEGGSYNDCIVWRNRENAVVRLGSTMLTLTQLIYLNNLRSYFWKLYVFVEKSKPAYKNNIG